MSTARADLGTALEPSRRHLTGAILLATRVVVIAALCGMSSGCGGARTISETSRDPVADEVRRLAAVHLRCSAHLVRVNPSHELAICESREPPDGEGGGVRSRTGRCVHWSDERVGVEAHAWVAEGCGYAEQYVRDPCGYGTSVWMLADQLVLGLLDCSFF